MEKYNNSGGNPDRIGKIGRKLLGFWNTARAAESRVTLGRTEARHESSDRLSRLWNRQFLEMREKVTTSDDGTEEKLIIDGSNHYLELIRQTGRADTLRFSKVHDLDHVGRSLIGSLETYAPQPGTGLMLSSSEVYRYRVLPGVKGSELLTLDPDSDFHVSLALNSATKAIGQEAVSRIMETNQFTHELLRRVDFAHGEYEVIDLNTPMSNTDLDTLYITTNRTIDSASR